MNCRYLDAEGKSQPVVMGCYGIGITRMAAAWIEQNHDDKGIIWSPQIAPFAAHLIGLNLEDPAVSAKRRRSTSSSSRPASRCSSMTGPRAPARNSATPT